MTYEYPSVSDFREYFQRDFPFGTDPKCSVLDFDITKAFGQAKFNFNPDLFCSQEQFTIGFLYLTAHYLCVDFRASSQGINGQFAWLEQSKSVGDVSQSFQIPDRILADPYMAMLTQTNYGAKYLQLLLPQLCGQIFTVAGYTHP